MSLYKFSILFLTVFSLGASASTFTDNECLESSFNTTVKHKVQPFGLTENILNVEKSGCLVKVTHQKLKVMNKNWEIDVCREPVHIKEVSGGVTVLKREWDCSKKDRGDYCKTVKKIHSIIQDDGLIFADGLKENIDTDHGKIYCSFLVLKKYLNQGFVFSKSEKYSGELFNKVVKKEEVLETSSEASSIVDDGPADF